jgi:hypothetical protein
MGNWIPVMKPDTWVVAPSNLRDTTECGVLPARRQEEDC